VAEVFRRKPIITYLTEREPLLPRPKIIDFLSLDELRSFAQIPAVDTVRPEAAIEVVASSSWARGLAEGVCGLGYAGFAPGTPEFDRCVYHVSHKVAARTLGMAWTPPPTPPTAAPPRRPRRR